MKSWAPFQNGLIDGRFSAPKPPGCIDVTLSTSHVSQLENDQRPVTVAVLLALAERFDLDRTTSPDQTPGWSRTCVRSSPTSGDDRSDRGTGRADAQCAVSRSD
jgi:transcriptional regulator with XRE-family HTH domain